MNTISKIRILYLLSLGLLCGPIESSAQLVLNQAGTTGDHSNPVSVTMVSPFGTTGAFYAYISSGPGPDPVSPFGNRNYVVTTMYRNAVQSPMETVTADQASRTIIYYDGLGRAMQDVQWQSSPLKKDIVEHRVYDQYGVASRTFLPYAEVTDNDGQYKTVAASRQLSFYSTASIANVGVVRTGSPYADLVYEKSPLLRRESSGFAGDAWQTQTNHTVKEEQGTNSTNSVRQWSISGASINGTSFYPASSLRMSRVYDENNTNRSRAGSVEEYKDYEGRTILKRLWETSGKSLDTYYVYDLMGRLRFVIPPGVKVSSFDEDDATFTNYVYGYRYDAKGRMVEKKVPGKAGWEYMVYNRADQVVMTQDPGQKSRNEWSYVRYDGRGRIASTGLYTSTAPQSRVSVQALVDGHGGPLWESRNRNVSYANLSFPTAVSGVTVKELTVNYYDDYLFTGAAALSATGVTSKLTHGLATGAVVYQTNGTSGLASASYYDDYGRNVEAIAQNHLGGTDRIRNTYSFVGELLTSKRDHSASSGGATTTLLTTQNYDHRGRLSEVRKKVNTQTEVIQSRLEYNELGQLREKKQHSENGGANFINSIAYTYNERGWMTGLSSPHFTQEIRYADPISGTAQYNGNISQLRWGHGGPISQTTNYVYDGINRLLSGVKTGAVMNEQVEYDDMGNISKLTRDNGAAINYSYIGNRLAGLNGGLSASYSYDVNGNATQDRTGMTFSYNHLNLPATANKSGLSVTYLYDAVGSKLRKTVTVGSTTTQRDYVGGIEYSKVGGGSSTIERIHTEEGYLQNNGGTYTYHYNLTDHLGNVRATLQRTSATAGTVIQKHDYYPFGKSKALQVSGINKYLYNGKEVQEELGNQYDYGARFYDAEIGRWNVVDPLAEKYYPLSPFVYVANNPVNAIDPDGKDIIFVVGKSQQQYTYRNGQLYVGGKAIFTPFTDGSYIFLSKNQNILLQQYKNIASSGDRLMTGMLNTLVDSKNKHYVRDIADYRDPDGSSQVGVYDPAKAALANENNMFGSTTGTSSVSYWNFPSSRKEGYSDLETTVHEMRHQLDIDQGKFPRNTRQAELNAVSSQNYIRKKEGKTEKTNYGKVYNYSRDELNEAHDKLNDIINKAMSGNGNVRINFY